MHLSDSFLAELRVPVRRAHVDLHVGHESHWVVIFLPPSTAPEELFEDETPFFPAEVDGKVWFFARSSVTSLAVDASDSQSPSQDLPHQSRSVRVHFAGGRSVSGVLMSPGLRVRTLDILNERSRSFALHVDGKVHHIAKAHVQRIVEIG